MMVECSKELKNKRDFDGIELEFLIKDKCLLLKNISNEKLFDMMKEYYKYDYEDKLEQIIEKENEIIIFFKDEYTVDLAKQEILYKTDDKHDDSYYLIKELKKWEL